MARSNADLLALQAELTNDPQSLGLTTAAADDVANADALNLVRPSLQVDRDSIPNSEIFLNIDRDEYVALAQADREWLNGVAHGGSINPKAGGEVREGLLQLFGVGSETRTNLLAILTADANRIDHLHQDGLLEAGGSVTPSDIARARNAV